MKKYRLLATSLVIVLACIALIGSLVLPEESSSSEEGSWSGVDETVIEKHAEESGQPASDPLINTDKGDLLLFVFALGGAIGGFVAGYCWCRVTRPDAKQIN